MTQGESLALSTDLNSCSSGPGLTDQTSRSVTYDLNDPWNGKEGAMPQIAPSLEQSQVN